FFLGCSRIVALSLRKGTIMQSTLSPRLLACGAALLLALIILTGIATADRATWLMDVTPVIIVVPLLWATVQRYPLTPLLYVLIFFHAWILSGGGMDTYAKVPVGFEVQSWRRLDRKPYDNLGHFFPGLVPALAAREILLRGAIVRGRRMLA